jgi:hypothetical protein
LSKKIYVLPNVACIFILSRRCVNGYYCDQLELRLDERGSMKLRFDMGKPIPKIVKIREMAISANRARKYKMDKVVEAIKEALRIQPKEASYGIRGSKPLSEACVRGLNTLQ